MEDVLPTPEPASRATTSRRSSWYDDDPSGEENLTNVASIEPTPPDGGYGWVVAVGLFLVNTHTWGIASVSTLLALARKAVDHWLTDHPYRPGLSLWRIISGKQA